MQCTTRKYLIAILVWLECYFVPAWFFAPPDCSYEFESDGKSRVEIKSCSFDQLNLEIFFDKDPVSKYIEFTCQLACNNDDREHRSLNKPEYQVTENPISLNFTLNPPLSRAPTDYNCSLRICYRVSDFLYQEYLLTNSPLFYPHEGCRKKMPEEVIMPFSFSRVTSSFYFEDYELLTSYKQDLSVEVKSTSIVETRTSGQVSVSPIASQTHISSIPLHSTSVTPIASQTHISSIFLNSTSSHRLNNKITSTTSLSSSFMHYTSISIPASIDLVSRSNGQADLLATMIGTIVVIVILTIIIVIISIIICICLTSPLRKYTNHDTVQQVDFDEKNFGMFFHLTPSASLVTILSPLSPVNKEMENSKNDTETFSESYSVKDESSSEISFRISSPTKKIDFYGSQEVAPSKTNITENSDNITVGVLSIESTSSVDVLQQQSDSLSQDNTQSVVIQEDSYEHEHYPYIHTYDKIC